MKITVYEWDSISEQTGQVTEPGDEDVALLQSKNAAALFVDAGDGCMKVYFVGSEAAATALMRLWEQFTETDKTHNDPIQTRSQFASWCQANAKNV